MAEAYVAKVASEALTKPTSSIVDALLAPKLARLRQWAIERDLQSQIEESRLHIAFEGYLRRLLRRVSGMQTLVFPQLNLPLPDAYEPLSLRECHSRRHVGEHELRSIGARSYIIDGAGMGKSTFARHLILDELTNHDRIPLLLELRRIPAGSSLFSAITAEFDELEKTFNSDALLRLLSVGRFLIVLDGFDELPIECRDSIATDIEELASKSENSALVLTTRPEINLPAMPEARALEFAALTLPQAESLVRRYDKFASLDVGARLIHEFDKVPHRFLETPLLVALLYRTYGFNGSISTRVSTFYDEMYGALYKGHDFSKSGFSRAKVSGLDFEDFRRLLRALCFIVIAQQRNSFRSESAAANAIDGAVRMVSSKPLSSSAFLHDLLLPVPLMVRDGSELRFAHKTIAEFFAAEYIAFARNAESLLHEIQNGPLRGRFQQSISFIADVDPLLFRRVVAAPAGEAALRDGSTESDPFLRSVNFNGSSRISLWPRSEAIDETDDKKRMRIPHPVDAPGGMSFFYGTVDSDPYVMAATHPTRVSRIPGPAWTLITREAPSPSLHHVDFEFSGLQDHLPLRTWVSLRDPLIQHIAAHPAINRILCILLSFFTDGYATIGDRQYTVRVLDNEAIRTLLTSVHEQQEADEWLGRLLQRPPRSSGDDGDTESL